MSDLSSYIQISANTVTTSNITTTGSNSVVSTTGNISAGNISTTGNITGNYILGNGSQLTGIAARSSNTAVTVTGNAQSNITSVGTLTSLTSSGLISTTGNIVGNYILGNGSQLTGLVSSYSNSNVISLLSAYSNNISSSGNIIAGNVITSGALQGGTGTQGIALQPWTGGGSYAALYSTAITPGNGNYSILVNGLNTWLNAGSGGSLFFRINNNTTPTAFTINSSQANIGNIGTANSSAASTQTLLVNGGGLGVIGNSYFTNTIGIGGNLILSNSSSLISIPGSNANITIDPDGIGKVNIIGSLSATGNIQGNYIFGDGSQLTNITIGSTNPVSTSGNVTGGNLITAGNVSATGNVTANYFFGNGSQLTSITGANVTGNVANATFATTANTANIANTAYSVSGANVTGNVANATYALSSGSAVGTSATVTSNAQPNITSVGTLTSITSSGLISTTGNVTGNYIIGNGSLLTGLAATYGNSNVANYLPTYSGNLGNVGTITATGNIVGNYLIGNGSQLTSITGANVTGNVANATYALSSGSAVGTSATVTSNAQPNITSVGTLTSITSSGLISTTGNVTGNYIIGNGSQLSAITGANITGTIANATYALSAGSAVGTAATVTTNAQPNITSVGTLTSLSITGNTTAGNLLTAGLISTTGTVYSNNITVANNITTTDISVTGNIFGSSGNLYFNSNVSESWATWLLNNDSTSYGGPNSSVLVVPYSDDTHTGEIYFQGTGGIAEIFWAGPGNGPTLSNVFNILSDAGNIVLTTIDGGGTLYSSVFDTYGNLTLPGNAIVGNGIVSATYNPSTSVGAALTVAGANTQGGAGYFDFLKATNNQAGAVHPNKSFRISNTAGDLQIINSAYSQNIFNLTDSGNLTIPGTLTVSGNANVQGTLTYNNTSTITTSNLVLGLANTQTGTNVNGAGIVAGNTNQASFLYSYSGNIWNSNLTINSANNITAAGYMSATGNIKGNYIIGNGSQLTGIAPGYANSNAASFLAAFGSNTISSTGSVTTTSNITGGNILTSGIVSASGNIFGNVANINTIFAGTTVTNLYNTAAFNAIGNSAGNTITGLNVINLGGGAGSGSGIDFYTYTGNGFGPGARIFGYDTGNYSANINFATKISGAGNNSLSTGMVLSGNSLYIGNSAGNVYAGNVILPGGTLQATGAVNPQYINVTNNFIQTVQASGTDIAWDTVSSSSGIPYDLTTGKFTLTANVTYNIIGMLSFSNYSANGYILYQVVDGSNNTPISSQVVTAPYNTGYNEVNNLSIDIVYTPSTNQTIKFRVTGGTNLLSAQHRGGYFSRASIVQLNPTATLSTVNTISASGNINVGGLIKSTGGIYNGNPNIITNTTTLGPQFLGGMVEIGGTTNFTVTLPNPTTYVGAMIAIWLNTNNTITLSTPAGGLYGPNGSGTSTKTIVNTSTQYWHLWSDGYNWALFGIKTA